MIGIDYGSNLAGRTVVAYCYNNELYFYSSEKKKSADEFFKLRLKALIVEMVLKVELNEVELIETYPSFDTKRLSLKELNYKKMLENIPTVLAIV